MPTESQHHPSQLFTLRIWQESVGEGEVEWRGQLQHVPSGQNFYFREWHVLIRLLLAELTELKLPPDALRGRSPADDSQ